MESAVLVTIRETVLVVAGCVALLPAAVYLFAVFLRHLSRKGGNSNHSSLPVLKDVLGEDSVSADALSEASAKKGDSQTRREDLIFPDNAPPQSATAGPSLHNERPARPAEFTLFFGRGSFDREESQARQESVGASDDTDAHTEPSPDKENSRILKEAFFDNEDTPRTSPPSPQHERTTSSGQFTQVFGRGNPDRRGVQEQNSSSQVSGNEASSMPGPPLFSRRRSTNPALGVGRVTPSETLYNIRKRGDQVHFALTSNSFVAPGSAFVMSVWAYLGTQYPQVLERARLTLAWGELAVQSVGPFELARGVRLSLKMEITGLTVPDTENTILWIGEIANATFAAEVPADAPQGPHVGYVRIYANGLQVGRLHFTVQVANVTAESVTVADNEERYRKAFASYASGDRTAVLARIQGILKIAPDLNIFLDVHSLRSGQAWATRLHDEIVSSDVFYLFWSENAKQSKWVEREWRCALETKGIDFIDPVPLVAPEIVPPPPELAAKHFNDWTLAYMRLGS